MKTFPDGGGGGGGGEGGGEGGLGVNSLIGLLGEASPKRGTFNRLEICHFSL